MEGKGSMSPFRFFYSVWVFFIVCLAILAGLKGLFWVLAILGAFAVCLLAWLVVHDTWALNIEEIEGRTNLFNARSRFVISLTSTTEDQRKFLAVEWPELGVEFGHEHIVYLLHNGMNTGILMEFFRVFLQDSSDNEFVDQRNYNDDKYLQKRFDCSRDEVRRQWNIATDYLRKTGYLKMGSMAGNHTYQWTSKGHYRKLCRTYATMPNVDVGEITEAAA